MNHGNKKGDYYIEIFQCFWFVFSALYFFGSVSTLLTKIWLQIALWSSLKKTIRHVLFYLKKWKAKWWFEIPTNTRKWECFLVPLHELPGFWAQTYRSKKDPIHTKGSGWGMHGALASVLLLSAQWREFIPAMIYYLISSKQNRRILGGKLNSLSKLLFSRPYESKLGERRHGTNA